MAHFQQQFQAVFQAAQLSFWHWDAIADRVCYSPGSAAVYGCAGEQELPLTREAVYRLVHPEDRARLHHSMDEVLVRGADCFHCEYRFQRRSGAWRWMSRRGIAIRNHAGQLTALLGVTIDITEQRAAQQALTEQFSITSRLIAGLAHDLNGPLHALQALLYLLQEEPSVPAQALNYLRMGQTELNQLAGLVRHTVGLYAAPQRRDRVVLAQLIEQVLGVCQGLARKSGVELQHDLRSNAAIVAVSGQIRQVLSVLMLRALDAAPGGVIRIRLAEGRDFRHPGRQLLRLSIADNGAVLEPAQRAHLFEPFGSAALDGIGLNLWLARELVEELGGSIHIKSLAGRGSCFTIFLPISEGLSLDGERGCAA